MDHGLTARVKERHHYDIMLQGVATNNIRLVSLWRRCGCRGGTQCYCVSKDAMTFLRKSGENEDSVYVAFIARVFNRSW